METKKFVFLKLKFKGINCKIFYLIKNRKGFENFSFCNFPYILDSQSKSKILQIDSSIQQNEKFRQSLFNSVFSQQQTSLFLVLTAKRDNILETALFEIEKKEEDLKKPLVIIIFNLQFIIRE